MEPGLQAVKVPSAGGGPSVRAVLAVLLVALGLAIVKPWGSDGGNAGASAGPFLPGTGFRASPTRAETPSPSPHRIGPTDEQLVATFCLEPSGWRVFSTEEFSGRQIRSWTAADPIATADGPDDPRIPITPVASRTVLALGYCTPIVGPDRPPAGTATTIYWRSSPSPTGGNEPVDIRRVLPRVAASSLGAVYAAPRTSYPTATTGWQTGTWIFRVTGDPAYVRWFGVAVEILPPLPAPPVAPTPAQAAP